MAKRFASDLFLSYGDKDKAIVRATSEQLRGDGLKHKCELVPCMSARAFGSKWAWLEAGTFRFRDPLNQERRFTSLRLEDALIKGFLARFLYICINWHHVSSPSVVGTLTLNRSKTGDCYGRHS